MLGYNRTLVNPPTEQHEVAAQAEESAARRALVHDLLRRGYSAPEAQAQAEAQLPKA